MRTHAVISAGVAAVGLSALLAAPATATPTAGTRATQEVPIPGVQYHIRALHSGKCLDVRGGSQNDGAIIQQYRCNGTAAQTWVLHGVTGGFEIRALNSGKCVDVKGASKADYAAVVQYRCGLGAPNRTFRLQPGMFDQVFQIQAVHSNKCLDVKGASQQDGAPVVQYECNPAATDRNWVFERV